MGQGTVDSVSLAPSNKTTQFGLVFEGMIWIPSDGVYNFYLKSDDGSSLKIDGNRVINNDGLHGSIEKSASVNLTQGFHQIRVDYFQLLGSASLNLQWNGPGMTRRKLEGRGVLYHQLRR
ncbi:MAG: hypothetical protein RI953_2212 [Pseudomonadota bacterium]